MDHDIFGNRKFENGLENGVHYRVLLRQNGVGRNFRVLEKKEESPFFLSHRRIKENSNYAGNYGQTRRQKTLLPYLFFRDRTLCAHRLGENIT